MASVEHPAAEETARPFTISEKAKQLLGAKFVPDPMPPVEFNIEPQVLREERELAAELAAIDEAISAIVDRKRGGQHHRYSQIELLGLEGSERLSELAPA